jgi:hypothetical protein
VDKRIVIVGAGLAGLTAVDTLLRNNIDPANITMLYQGTDPWNRDEFDGFGGNIWKQELTLLKKPEALAIASIIPLNTVSDKLAQLKYLIGRYCLERFSETEDSFYLTGEEATYLTQRMWGAFSSKRINLINQASCRPITNISNYLVYDKEGEEKQEQQFDYLILAPGQLGYNVVHSLAEYYNEAQPQDIKTASNISITHNFQIYDNIYVVGGILGFECTTSSAIQGIIAAESILNSL